MDTDQPQLTLNSTQFHLLGDGPLAFHPEQLSFKVASFITVGLSQSGPIDKFRLISGKH